MHNAEEASPPDDASLSRHREGKGGGSGEYAPVNYAGDKGAAAQKDVSEQAFLGFVFNALSTIFVMVMGVCAKLAGDASC